MTQTLEAGQTVKIVVPTTIRVTGTALHPVLDASGWVIPEALSDAITITVSSTPVTVSENDQDVSLTLTISASNDGRFTGESIDLSTVVMSLASGTTWHDSAELTLHNIVTGSDNTPPRVTPVFSADDRGNGTLDFTPFAGQIGDTAAGQLHQTDYLAAFFTADDDEDGDLTDRVRISSEPSFDSFTAGDYGIKGSVTDSGGLSASSPGQRDITVWNLIQVDGSYYNAIALDSRGRPWSWGRNSYGENHGAADGVQRIPTQIVNLPTDRRAVSVAASNEASFVVMDDGSVYSFGSDASGQLGNGSAGSSPTPSKITFPGDPTIIKVDAFNNSVAALASDGSIYVWGSGSYGALGLGSTTNQQSPQPINVSGATDLSMGLYGGIARIEDGQVMVWGSNWHGQNGDGTTNTSTGAHTLPTLVPGLTGVTKVSAGYDFMLAATSNGAVYGWGENANYRANPNQGASLSDVKVPTEITNLPSGKTVRQVNAGFDYGQVVYSDGTLWSWGYNSYDSLFVGNITSRSTPIQSPIASDVSIITGNYDISLYINKSGTMIYGRGYGGRWGLGNNSVADYISSSGTVAQISLNNIYNDGTGVDINGDPTPLSTSSPSSVVARMLRNPYTPTPPGYTRPEGLTTEPSSPPEVTEPDNPPTETSSSGQPTATEPSSPSEVTEPEEPSESAGPGEPSETQEPDQDDAATPDSRNEDIIPGESPAPVDIDAQRRDVVETLPNLPAPLRFMVPTLSMSSEPDN